jgi:adenylosuccinate lyase
MERAPGLLFSQSALGVLLKKGMDRQAAYAIVQAAAMRVWEKQAASLRAALWESPEVKKLVSAPELDAAFEMSAYTRHVDALFARAGLS